MQKEHEKDPRAAALGQRGGQKRMGLLSAQERSELSRHAAHTRWHPLEAKARRERADEIVYLIKQALKDGEQPQFFKKTTD